MADGVATQAWTCSRCEVTASWMPGVERPEMPVAWIEEDGEIYCLECRRDMAGEAVDIPDDAPANQRQQLRSFARVEFEVKRDPERADNQIAQSCRTSIPAVRKARVRLGLQGERPG